MVYVLFKMEGWDGGIEYESVREEYSLKNHTELNFYQIV